MEVILPYQPLEQSIQKYMHRMKGIRTLRKSNMSYIWNTEKETWRSWEKNRNLERYSKSVYQEKPNVLLEAYTLVAPELVYEMHPNND